MAVDDKQLYVVRRDYSGGQNTRQSGNVIGENQATSLQNVDIEVAGKRKKRLGSVLISDDMGSESVLALHNYERQGYTDQLMMVEDNNVNASESEGDHTEVKGDFTSSLTDWGMVSIKESGLTPDDVVIIQNGTDNPFRLHKASDDTWATQDLGSTAGTGSDSPPKSTVMCWYSNRLWVLKNDQLYFSTAYSSDYSSAFDTNSDVFRIPVGEERGLAPTRDTGIIVMGKNAIWGIAPSTTPDATDQPEPLVTWQGVVSKKGWCQAGDDLYYFSDDGFRSLKRTIQDKLQTGTSYPLSFPLKDAFDSIDWSHIERLCMVYFNNKIIISVPTSASTFDTWVYYPATGGFVIWTDLSSRAWARHKISGEERLYGTKHGDGTVYRYEYGFTDYGTSTTNGTAIDYVEEGRSEDFGQPLHYKVGGVVEVIGKQTADDIDLTVSAKIDNGVYIQLGKVDVESSSAPTLPISLPFTLAGGSVAREKFHLDNLGRFREIKFKIEASDANTEQLEIYELNATTFREEYESE